MDNIEKLLKQVINNQDDMKKNISDIKSKLDSVVDQTADLTEFRTQTNQNFSDIKDTLKFIIHKEVENEQEIFKLKQVNENK
ncbi:hypothetical protein [Sporosalibacterium faouarense]|uniref:hypothetical protein n=1 Tax=Sporosalibacterium faouarense TaxID=516123 RepID=UPI00141C42BD|nr:hypothetical protein [Sporosalibacterium faouarense]MTI49911.1 hypothetical protein [Bacillota bacterium]